MKIFANQPLKASLAYFSFVVIITGTALSLIKAEERKTVRQAEAAAAAVKKQHQQLVKSVDPKQLKCMTDNIYYEAGNQGTLGQAAVGRVVVNRVKHGFGSSVCDVVYKKTHFKEEDEFGTQWTKTMCQFSWVCLNEKPGINRENYAQAKEVAWKILSVDAYREVVPSNTLYFHAVHVEPSWGLQRVKKINQHIFYSNQKVKHSNQ